MQVTPLELGLAAAAVAIVFGPKRLPNFKRSADANMVDLSLLAASRPAAARAPSPLAQQHTQQRSTPPPVAIPERQYAMSGPSRPQPLKLPNEL